MDPDRLLADLNDAQRAAVTSTAAPLCILAGAGSGKTRVLTRRIGHRVATDDADPRHVLALTFTRKAAGELGTRLRQLGMRDTVAAGTFHSIAFAQLRARWEERGIRPPDLLDRKVRFVADLLPRDVKAIDVVGEIEWAKARRVGPDSYVDAAHRAARTPPMAPHVVAEAFARYEATKRQRRMVDFDDLLALCIRDMGDPEVAAAQRWRFRHLFVDEFQDVNPLQFDLLRAWLGDRTDLCVVGDPNQAIYAWNGADAGYLVDFDRWFPGAESVALVENYRSTPQILAAANAVLARSRHGASLRANRPDGPAPLIRSFPSDAAEARGIARAVRDARAPNARWSTQAVLVRTNAQTALLSEALQAAGIPHRVRGGTGLLEQAEVRTALAGLRRHHGAFDVAIADLEATIEPEPTADPDDEAAAAPTDTSDAVAERRANLEMLVRLARDYQRIDLAPTSDGFLAWLRATVGSDAPDRDAVDVTTFHAAKGLEWPVVHLAGLEQGYVPIGHATTPAALAEERRLFYVAVTRAEERLLCSWAETRTFGQRTAQREPSPYLVQVEAALDDAGGDVSARRATLRAQREALRSGPRDRGRRRSGGAPTELDPADQPLFEALRQWRATRARAAGVPAYVVFNDATLVAVASRRPASRAELLGLPGIGPVKAERHGDDLLSVVAEHGRTPG
ncbi:ATP-dependent DNA helicase UvrD2 [Actinomarinicola tropica]|uniref:DNA 3'-5' helicase n=1 Tax=Actinomarinicola tropica TaxID=2789776 RepID=A0A5Q2RNP1_9ACTN|nr:ATP-dependent DNA helicase UvrD2 [Actinomarinicola tropica]QGG94805.1 AAA family ATPase [Actinomarinicola tropica]